VQFFLSRVLWLLLIALALWPASTQAEQSVTLTWDLNPEPDVAGYILYYGRASSAYTDTVNAGNANISSVAGLADSTTYYFVVTAYNTIGLESLPSDEISYTTPGPTNAPPSPPPVSATLAASIVNGTGATLNALVNPNGSSTIAWFDWGTSTSYGISTSAWDLGAGLSTLPVNSSINGLLPGETYHFRVVATNAGGWSVGGDASFTTPAVAPIVLTQPATSISFKGATLNATVDPNGTATTAYFQYGLNASYTSQTAATGLGSAAGALSFKSSVSGLAAGTTYHFRVVAVSAAGNVVGADSSFTTATRGKQ
jgi:Fibronectin type III domain